MSAEPLRDFDPQPFVQVTDFLTPHEQANLLEATLASEGRLDRTDAERLARRLRLLLPNVLPAFDVSRAVPAEEFVLEVERGGEAQPPDAAGAASDDEITCTYYFHREPKPFYGGAIRLRGGENVHLVEPRNNAVLIYPSSAFVEETALRTESAILDDARFAINVRIR